MSLLLAPVLNETSPEAPSSDLGVMLTGGGAHAAYQAGLLLGIARHFPNLKFNVITGVSAGAINAALLAAGEGSLKEKATQLAEIWSALEYEHIFRLQFSSLLPFRNKVASMFPKRRWIRPRALVDATPLRRLLRRVLRARDRGPIEGIKRNLRSGELTAVALTTLDYSTGQTVRWVQGRNSDDLESPNRRSVSTMLTLDHVMASAALPLVFPAVRIGDTWHGDGSIRLAAPLSAAVHLGAARILAMSTAYQSASEETPRAGARTYPPVARILSHLADAVFLDVIDEDVERMTRMNEMLREMPEGTRNGFRQIDLCVLRPSVVLGTLAAPYEKNLPRQIKLLASAIGARRTDSGDFLSLLMFDPGYMAKLIELGERDVAMRLDHLRAFFGDVHSTSQQSNAL
jgi:NTE family protein